MATIWHTLTIRSICECLFFVENRSWKQRKLKILDHSKGKSSERARTHRQNDVSQFLMFWLQNNSWWSQATRAKATTRRRRREREKCEREKNAPKLRRNPKFTLKFVYFYGNLRLKQRTAQHLTQFQKFLNDFFFFFWFHILCCVVIWSLTCALTLCAFLLASLFVCLSIAICLGMCVRVCACVHS